jgi:hypothetical protein
MPELRRVIESSTPTMSTGERQLLQPVDVLLLSLDLRALDDPIGGSALEDRTAAAGRAVDRIAALPLRDLFSNLDHEDTWRQTITDVKISLDDHDTKDKETLDSILDQYGAHLSTAYRSDSLSRSPSRDSRPSVEEQRLREWLEKTRSR